MPGNYTSTGSIVADAPVLASVVKDNFDDLDDALFALASQISARNVVECRLSLASGDPINAAGTSAGSTIYLVPFRGNRIGIYNGSTWVSKELSAQIATAISQNKSTTTVSGSPNITVATADLRVGMDVTGTGIAANSVITAITGTNAATLNNNATASGTNSLTYALADTLPSDVFAYIGWDNNIHLEFIRWTNVTTRATALTTQDGFYVKNGAATRRYLGTIYTVSSSISVFGNMIHVWNYYNRLPRVAVINETADSWSYTTTTYRYMNNNSSNRIEVVTGVSEDVIDATAQVHAATSGNPPAIAIGIDTPSNIGSSRLASGVFTSTIGLMVAQDGLYPGIGWRLLIPAERGNTGVTFYGDNGATNVVLSGLRAVVYC